MWPRCSSRLFYQYLSSARKFGSDRPVCAHRDTLQKHSQTHRRCLGLVRFGGLRESQMGQPVGVMLVYRQQPGTMMGSRETS